MATGAVADGHSFAERESVTATRVIQVCIAIVLSVPAATFAGPPAPRTVALTGQQPPGLPPGSFFHRFYDILIDQSDRVAFLATVSGPAITPETSVGIWSDRSGTLELVCRTGTHAPGTPRGVLFWSFHIGSLSVSSSGSVTFFAELTEPGAASGNTAGIFSNGSGVLRPVAIAGSTAPGLPPGAVFAVFDVGSSHDPIPAGMQTEAAFIARVHGPGIGTANDHGIWASQQGNLSLVMSAAKSNPAERLQFLVVNDTGAVAFLQGSFVHSSRIVSTCSGSLQTIVETGHPAPGTSSGVFYTSLGLPRINNACQLAFQAYLAGMSVNETNDQGVWSERLGQLNLVARKGDPAPGTAPNMVFNWFREPALGGSGHIAFRANLIETGVEVSNHQSIWSDGTNALRLVAKVGDPAPGLDPNTHFGHLFDPSINADGRVLFSSYLAGTEDNSGDSIWATDADGDPELILRRGDQIQVAPGNPRTIVKLDLPFAPLGAIGAIGSGGEDGRRRVFNNHGRFVFHVNLDDGAKGIFVGAIPRAAVTAPLDIRPGACPNGLNRRSRGILPVAIVGTAELNVTQIDIETVRLARADGLGGEVAPIAGPPGPPARIRDVAARGSGAACTCEPARPDGVDDLLLSFPIEQLVDALNLAEFVPGDEVQLTLSGSLADGTPLTTAADCVRIVR